MLGGINELTSKHGGFDGPHESKIQAARTQVGEIQGEEDQEEEGETDRRRRAPRRSRKEGQEGAKAQDGRQEEGGAGKQGGAQGVPADNGAVPRTDATGAGAVLFGAAAA